MVTSRRNRGRFALLAGILALASVSRVHAFSGGITTQSFNQTNGCNQCHFGGITPTVTLWS